MLAIRRPRLSQPTAARSEVPAHVPAAAAAAALPRRGAALAALAVCSVLWWLPPSLPPLGLILTVLLLAWTATTPAWRWSSPAWRVALGGLLLTACVALYPSIDLELSLPRFYGILLGVAALGVLGAALSSERALWTASLGLLAVAGVLAGLALAGMNRPIAEVKGLPLDPIYDRLPRLIDDLPFADVLFTDERGVNANKLAAPLAMLAPLGLATALYAPRRRLRLAWGVGLAMVLFTILLTQSRSAYFALGAGLLALLLVRSRWFGLALVPLAALALWALVWGFAPRDLVKDWPTPPLIGGDRTIDGGRWTTEGTLRNRQLVWSAALTMVEYFPLTGIGLGTFSLVAELMDEAGFIYGIDAETTPHAHNLPLQVAVDLGLPGLGFFILLAVCVARTARRAVARAPSRGVRGLAVGAACGLLAYYVYGLTDAIGLGEKPGMLFWLLLALLVACARLAERPPSPVVMPSPWPPSSTSAADKFAASVPSPSI